MLSLETINQEIKSAMLAKDKLKLEALRGVKKEFLEAKTAKEASDKLSDEAAILILQKMVKQRKDSAAIFSEQNRPELAKKELAEAQIIRCYLPEQLSPETLESEIKRIIVQVDAASMKDMGRVMGIATKQLAGRAEGRAISNTVKKLLT